MGRVVFKFGMKSFEEVGRELSVGIDKEEIFTGGVFGAEIALDADVALGAGEKSIRGKPGGNFLG